MSEILFNVKTIIKKLKEILQCDICHNLFDFKNHMPIISNSGETFCSQCISENKNNIYLGSKFDNNNSNNILSPFKFVENLKLKKIIKDVLNLYDKAIKEKNIIFSKQLTERNNNQRFGHYLLTYNNSSTALREKEISSNEYIYNNSNKNINNNKLNKSKNNSINNSDNNNLNKKEKKEQDKNINSNNIENPEHNCKIISKEINLKNSIIKPNNNKINVNTLNINNLNNLNISDTDDNLNTMVLNDEINTNFNKENINFFEDKESDIKKIANDSIDTIPFNEEKSTVNMSFKDEFNELWMKKDDMPSELMVNQNDFKNNINKYVFINKNNFIYKNNQKVSGSSLNINKKGDILSKNKKTEKENKFIYQLSEPNFENININKNNLYDFDKLKIKKEEEKSSNTKINENEIKKIYKNSNYYEDKKINNKENILNSNESKENKNKEYYKINKNKCQAVRRQIAPKEIHKKIEEDENENIIYKNKTTFRDNNKKDENKNILFDGDEIKIVIKNINNVYDNESIQRKLLITENNINKLFKNKNNNEKIFDDNNEKPRFTYNNSNANHPYNKKILGKTNLSPYKNNSIENSVGKNFNKAENYKKINCSINKSKYRTISHAKTNENVNTDNLSTNEMIGSITSRERKTDCFNNIKQIPKITSIFLKIDNQKQNIINKNFVDRKKNNSDSSENNNYEYDDSIKNEGNKKYITDEKIISIGKAKTFMNKTKDELDNLNSGNNLNNKNSINTNDDNNQINKILEIKMIEFNKIFEQKIKSEKNKKTKNILLKNKNKYEEIVKNSINSPLINNNLNEIKILFLQNNDFYLGLISSQDNLPKKGFLYSFEGNYYEGTFVNGKKDGKGIVIYKNGAKYEGELKNNLHNGVGKLTQLDGEIFIGEWKEGKINGNGVRYHSNGDVYSGHYINNSRDGTGKYIFSNGDSYEGKWKNGKANGKGIYKFKNGNIYEGNFENNNFCGQGCFKNKKGEIYFGEFKNGVLDGEGIIISKNKEKFIGTFQNGKKHGKGDLYNKNGNIIKSGLWQSDEFIS